MKRFITESRISSIELSVKDIESILNILVYDGDVEKKMPFIADMEDFSDEEEDNGLVQWSYKAIKKAVNRLSTETFTETPCGKCPVFSFCVEDGPISPMNCEYYKVWLNW